ncbi:PREDICTED: uncharacterized protein LOC108972469 isoform X2 [Bactrocera latifrons]|uniref:Uncharacterized protein n=1 Tax=Bactrocera latifrons TaxID=174628 RepID=A0A0K8V7K6_BACLA|nr:PREDICTED: uncharacterized protein LOC108972469 isoform X2 [Bactrocera latifrons]
MKVSTVLIVIAILCTLSSCQQSTDADETTTTVSSASTTSAEEANGLTNTSTGSQPNQVITPTSAPTSAPTTAGSSSESDKGYSQWKEETEKRLDEKYDGIKREDLDRDINDLASSIQSALAKPGLSVAKQADLNFAHNLLMKGTANNDTSVKKAAYDEALHILISVVSMLNVGSASLR